MWTYSAMPGEPEYKNAQHERAMKAKVWDEETMNKIRSSGI
jgi:hypothetical protein